MASSENSERPLLPDSNAPVALARPSHQFDGLVVTA